MIGDKAQLKTEIESDFINVRNEANEKKKFSWRTETQGPFRLDVWNLLLGWLIAIERFTKIEHKITRNK